MNSLLDLYASNTVLIWLSIVGATTTTGFAYFYFLIPTKRKVPFAKVSFFETLAAFTGPDLPHFLLRLSREAQSTGRKNFRLPLPVWGGWYVVGDSSLIRQILQDPLTDKAAHAYKSTKMVVGAQENIFSSSNNSHWKMIRKATAHAFAKTEVQRMREIAIKYVDEWCNNDAMSQFCIRPFDPKNEMLKLILKAICDAAFEYQITDDEIKEFCTNLELALRESTAQIANPTREYFSFFIPDVRLAYESSAVIQKFALRVLNAYRNSSEKSKQSTLIRLIDSNENLQSDQQRVAEMLIYLIAGHDTTAVLLSNTLTLLAKYPKVLSKLRVEASGIPPDEWSTACPYFKFVVKESFRYIPVAAFGSIRTLGKVYDTGNGEILPKGATVSLTQVLPNRDETIFVDAEEFNPDRWHKPTQEMNDAVLPFSLGIRNCIGQSLANAEVDTILPYILSRFDLCLVDGGTTDYFLTWKLSGAQILLKQISSQ